jgi:acyl-CoA thioester hydrolase
MKNAALPVIYSARVRPEWIDGNGHLNVGYYMVVFDEVSDAFLITCGLTEEHRQKHQVTTFAVESHATFEREVREGDRLDFTTQLLAFTEKKIHYLHRMWHAEQGYLAATNELLSLHIGMRRRRAAPMAAPVLRRLEEISEAQAGLPRPPQVGRVIGVRARRPA